MKLYEFKKTIGNLNSIPNNTVRLIMFNDYPSAHRKKNEKELRGFTNMLIVLKNIVNENIRNKTFRPLITLMRT